MQCGNDYTVTVLAGDTKCNSSIFAKTNITTGTFSFGTKNDVRINWVAQIILMQKKNEILNFLKLPTIIDYQKDSFNQHICNVFCVQLPVLQ